MWVYYMLNGLEHEAECSLHLFSVTTVQSGKDFFLKNLSVELKPSQDVSGTKWKQGNPCTIEDQSGTSR